MGSIQFQVKGELPPKKGGGISMWNDRTQEPRLIQLRKEAVAAFEKNGSPPPFTKDIQLTLRLKVGEGFLRKRSADPNNFGDLDSLVGGVCDGLQRPPLDSECFFPSFCAIEDDSQVVKIAAEKDLGAGHHCRYEIELDGE